jgi:hypothetical protein
MLKERVLPDMIRVIPAVVGGSKSDGIEGAEGLSQFFGFAPDTEDENALLQVLRYYAPREVEAACVRVEVNEQCHEWGNDAYSPRSRL